MTPAESTMSSMKPCESSALRCRGSAAGRRADGVLRWRKWLSAGCGIAAVLAAPGIAAAGALVSGLVEPATASAGRSAADSPFNIQLAQSKAELQSQADQLFEQLLKDPKNVDLTPRFAEAVAKLGNLEAAVSSLERLRLLDCNFPSPTFLLARPPVHRLGRSRVVRGEHAYPLRADVACPAPCCTAGPAC
jgi:hypothetical protein